MSTAETDALRAELEWMRSRAKAKGALMLATTRISADASEVRRQGLPAANDKAEAVKVAVAAASALMDEIGDVNPEGEFELSRYAGDFRARMAEGNGLFVSATNLEDFNEAVVLVQQTIGVARQELDVELEFYAAQ